MKLLVVGATGLLGSNVVTSAHARNFDVTGTYHSSPPALDGDYVELDLSRTEQIKARIEDLTPTVVINCAAVTDVDGCESEPEWARVVNSRGPGVLARACQSIEAALVHVSTDYVFDGQTDGSYDETMAPNPIQHYGKTKLAGEQAVREHHDSPIVVRPSFIYGVHRGREQLVGFPAWVRDQLRVGESISLFRDQRVTPTRARPLATALLDLLAVDITGTYHVASRSCVSPYEFGDAIRRRMNADDHLIEQASLGDIERPAKRPRNTCLDVSKIESHLDRPQPTLDTDLDALVNML